VIEHVQVMTTVGTEQEAELIASSLVEAKLAACVQIGGPIRSRYRWQGAIEEASEWQCLVKTTTAAYPQVEAAIRSMHSYEEPEIIATPIVAGARGYLGWIDDSVE
jgi:periplasmic divalent cation tolerance protein